jgi:hypothetical protein
MPSNKENQKSEHKPEYIVNKRSSDGRVFDVIVQNGEHKGKSVTMGSISSRFAYYNIDKIKRK